MINNPWRPEPYSPEIKGDLVEYLIGCTLGGAHNLFYESKYFFVMRDRGILVG